MITPNAAAAVSEEICLDCLATGGLCVPHAKFVLPQLARNIGWLKLMGEARIEQRKRQRDRSAHPSESPQSVAHQSRKRAARLVAKAKSQPRKHRRGYLALALAMMRSRP